MELPTWAWIVLGIALLILVRRHHSTSVTISTGASEEEPPPVSEPVVLPIEDSIDLHAFAPRDIADVVSSYVQVASEGGFSEVRIIHGRGRGHQRARVRQVLQDHPLVESFRDAPPHRGGWGATIAWLKRPDS